MPQTLGLKVRRRFMVEEQALVVFLRFGSLNSDHKIWMTYTEISKKTGIKIPSQLSIIKRWRRRGFVIFNLKNKGGRCRMLNEEQINWMISMDTSRAWVTWAWGSGLLLWRTNFVWKLLIGAPSGLTTYDMALASIARTTDTTNHKPKIASSSDSSRSSQRNWGPLSLGNLTTRFCILMRQPSTFGRRRAGVGWGQGWNCHWLTIGGHQSQWSGHQRKPGLGPLPCYWWKQQCEPLQGLPHWTQGEVQWEESAAHPWQPEDSLCQEAQLSLY